MKSKDVIYSFLCAYAKLYGWEEKTKEDILYKLYKEVYFPNDTRLLFIAYGWIWAKTNNDTIANCYSNMLMCDLDAIYKKYGDTNAEPK